MKSMWNPVHGVAIILLCIFAVNCGRSSESGYDDESGLLDDYESVQPYSPVVEAQSLLGEGLVRPDFDTETQERLTQNLRNAISDFNETPDDPESIIWVARHTAYLWRYQDAIYILTDGLNEYPDDPKFYRHRGHRYITIREFDKAIEDLLKAVSLIRGTEDEIEEDGAPNEANIPVSTLHFNIYYHLGVAYYLKGQFDFAVDAFENTMAVSKNNDTRVSTADWLYMSYIRNGQVDKARSFIDAFDTDIKVLESHSYLNRIRLYKNEIRPEALLDDSDTNTLNLLTQGYGVAMWYMLNGERDRAFNILKDIIDTNYWAAFGYIAAEAEIARMDI